MSSFPVCDVTFDDDTHLGAFLITRFGDRLTLQVSKSHAGRHARHRH